MQSLIVGHKDKLEFLWTGFDDMSKPTAGDSGWQQTIVDFEPNLGQLEALTLDSLNRIHLLFANWTYQRFNIHNGVQGLKRRDCQIEFKNLGLNKKVKEPFSKMAVSVDMLVLYNLS